MSRGCACLGSNVGGISELIEKEYLHKKNDFKKLSLLICNLYDLKNMKKNSTKSFNKVLDYDKEILDVMRNDFYIKSMNK